MQSVKFPTVTLLKKAVVAHRGFPNIDRIAATQMFSLEGQLSDSAQRRTISADDLC